MGTSSSPRELERKLTLLSRAVDDTQVETLKQSGMAVKVAVLAKARPATGGDLRLSGTKNRKVGVNFAMRGKRVYVRALGPMHWLEDGVKSHAVAPKSAGGTRAARSAFITNAFGQGRQSLSFGKGRIKMLRFVDGSFRPYARNAGGLKAQHVWSEGVHAAEPVVARIFRQENGRAIRRVFNG